MRKSTEGGTTRYVYQGEHVALELDGSGAVVGTYSYYPGVDQPYLLRRGESVYYYLRDVPGSVVGLIDGQGRLVNEYRYTPFGEAEQVREEVANPLRFTAREYDRESGLYFYRARYYDPELGHLLSEDPTGLDGGIGRAGTPPPWPALP